MTRYIIFCLLFIAHFSYAQEGVRFEDLSLQEALAKAKSENKLVFADFSAVWCQPCKKMFEQEFPTKTAGDFFNPRFISVTFDIEKGEGIELARKYQVSGVPDFIILNPEGDIVHRFSGASPILTFIDNIKAGLGEETTLSALDKQYAGGKMKKKELMNYIQALAGSKRDQDVRKVSGELLQKLSKKEKFQAEYWPLFSEQISPYIKGEHFDFITENRRNFYKTVGKEAVDQYFKSYFDSRISIFFSDRLNDAQWEEFERLQQRLDGSDFEGKALIRIKTDYIQAKRERDPERVYLILKDAPAHFPAKELETFIYSSQALLDHATKEQLSRIAALEDSYVDLAEEGMRKTVMKIYFAPFKRMASTGIHWEEDPGFEEILFKSKAENKPIFMDCYTSWCGPCKIMDREVFTREDVGDYFNRNFICIKRDMEKGEGPALLERYGIQAFPTLLLIDSDGNAVHKLVGGMEASKLIESMKGGLKNMRDFEELQKRYKGGERDKAFLTEYAEALYTARSLDIEKVLTDLIPLLTEDEKISGKFWFIYSTPGLTPPGSENEAFLITHRERFREVIGAEEVDMRLSFKYYMIFMNIMSGKDTETSREDFQKMIETLKSLGLQDQTVLSYAYIVEAGRFDSMDKILKICEREFPKLQADRVPLVVYGNFIKDRMNKQQKTQWKKLGEKAISRIDNENYRKMLAEELSKQVE